MLRMSEPTSASRVAVVGGAVRLENGVGWGYMIVSSTQYVSDVYLKSNSVCKVDGS